MQWLAAISVKRPVFASVLVLVFVVVGVLGYTRLPVDRFPKVDFPTVVITTRLDGATPKEVETQITDHIEEAVNTVSGIDELRSVSSEGISQVIVVFLLEKNTDVAAQEIRDRVNRIITELPDDADPPIVEKLDPDAAPILNVALTAEKPQREMEGRRPRRERRRMADADSLGELALERVDVGTERRDPVGRHRVGDEPGVVRAEMRRRQVNPRPGRHAFAPDWLAVDIR